MDPRKIFSISLLLLSLSLIFSCFGNYGRVGMQWGPGKKKIIQEMVGNWEKYLVYYAGPSVSYPSAILFDPKKDSRKIIPHKWLPVKDQTQLDDIVEWLEFSPTYHPIRYRIRGPDNQIYGYLYSNVFTVLINSIDDNTLWVDDIPLPLNNYGGDGEKLK
jgi:hypothetical protein